MRNIRSNLSNLLAILAQRSTSAMGILVAFCPKHTLAQHWLMSPKTLSQCSHNFCLLAEMHTNRTNESAEKTWIQLMTTGIVTSQTSMENLADISEPQVLPNEQKDQWFNFPSVYSGFNGRNCFSPVETWMNRTLDQKNWKIVFIDPFTHLAELEV